MSSFQLNKDGDLDLSGNKLRLTTGVEAIRQHLQVKLSIFLGEWFLDISVGVPYFEEIFVKAPNIGAVSELLKVQILETPGVLDLLEFDFDFDAAARAFQLEFKALTTEGIIDFTNEVGV